MVACIAPNAEGGCGVGDDRNFCSDGGEGSLPVGHDPATGAPLFQCLHGTQCDRDTLCAPREPFEEQPELCSDSCQPGIRGGVEWTGRARNGKCEDGGEADSYAVEVTVSNGVATKRSGCGFGTDCTDCGIRRADTTGDQLAPWRRTPPPPPSESSSESRRLQQQTSLLELTPPLPPFPPPPQPPPRTPPPSPPPSPKPPPAPSVHPDRPSHGHECASDRQPDCDLERERRERRERCEGRER